jgi:hypothetical protein
MADADGRLTRSFARAKDSQAVTTWVIFSR